MVSAFATVLVAVLVAPLHHFAGPAGLLLHSALARRLRPPPLLSRR